MTIQPTIFHVPPDIQAGLDSGDFVRFGGVVRNRLGHIVKHLKEVPVSNSGAVSTAHSRTALNNRRAIMIICLSTLAATGAGIATLVARKRLETSKLVSNYNDSIRAYVEAVRDRDLGVDIIQQLMSDLDAVEAQAGIGGVTIDFSTKQAEALVKFALDYTRQLAEANSLDLTELLHQVGTPPSEPVGLRHLLEVQKHIFTLAA